MLVADSGPLIALARLELLRESRSCFHALWVPEVVYVEVTRKGELADARMLKAAAAAGVFEVIADIPTTVDAVSSYGLDPGETLAIALALQEHAAVLIDERKGRMASQALGLDVIGTLGMLALLKERGLLARIAIPVERLMAGGYYLPEALVDQLLRRFGER
uniref:DUF3368 domain-containing protein n=1 Tax=Acidithiobacillus sulfuriphilus TaxID=1867749 RepID=A0A3M8QSZ4_9PROT|nr:DUF3368 domain-containing protein [Acidithiobacillus sulfuriphilus]